MICDDKQNDGAHTEVRQSVCWMCTRAMRTDDSSEDMVMIAMATMGFMASDKALENTDYHPEMSVASCCVCVVT